MLARLMGYAALFLSGTRMVSAAEAHFTAQELEARGAIEVGGGELLQTFEVTCNG
jgi:hypothetical protein